MSVIGNLLFSAFSKHKLPFDKWAKLELLNAITNSLTYLLVMMLSVENITDPETKRMLNWAMIASIFVSWARFISFFLVVQSVSKLIMTLASMVSSMGTFILMITCYLIMISPLYFCILKTETIVADSAFFLFRMLIDNVYGTYWFLDDGPY